MPQDTRHRRLWADRKKWGLCAKCGKSKPAEGHARCEQCLQKMRDLRQRRRAQNLCTECGKPVYKEYSLCQDHYAYHSAAVKKHREEHRKAKVIYE